MNITREDTGELTAIIGLEIAPEDYQEAVTKNLKDYQRKASIPGFRPGKVPLGLVKKMYGKAVMADEINKLLNDHLSGYLSEEQLDVLGNPLPNKQKTKHARFEEGETLAFYFDIGLAPEIHLALGPETEVNAYTIQVDDKMVDNYIEDTRRQQGSYIHPEDAGEEDMISGEITEIGSDGLPVEQGTWKNVFFDLDKITDRKVKDALLSLKKEDEFVFQPVEFFGSAETASNQLKLPAGVFSHPEITFSLKVSDIIHVEPAALNAELFEKVYPGEKIETDHDFRERVRKDAAASFTGESDKVLFQDITGTLIETSRIPLPDEFLKRWLQEHGEQKMSEEEVERNYPSFARTMKWQLIENKLIRDHQIRVTEEEIRAYIRSHLLRQVNPEFADPEMEKKYETIVQAFMQNKEQVQKIHEQLFHAKLMELFRKTLTLKPVEVSYGEFIKLVTEKHEHDHDHEH